MACFNPLFLVVIWLSVALTAGPVCAESADRPSPPIQAATGPGGRDYSFNAVEATAYGKGAEGYWIIEPKQRADKPRPVVLFVHGLGLTQYTAYQSWIIHLVRKGNVVIYPRYHTGGLVDPTVFTGAAATAWSKAIARCDGKGHGLVDPKQLTMIGHSLGGTIIANLAARPQHYNLPAPKALMLLQPGDTKSDQGLGAFFPSLTEAHSTIAQGTLMLIVDVEGDYFVSPKAGQRILTTRLRSMRKTSAACCCGQMIIASPRSLRTICYRWRGPIGRRVRAESTPTTLRCGAGSMRCKPARWATSSSTD